MSYQAIKDLVGYALRTGLIDEYDRPWAVNELLQAMGMDAWEEPAETHERPLEDILKELLDDAAARGRIEDDTTNRDLFDTELMGRLTPRPSQVISEFRRRYQAGPHGSRHPGFRTDGGGAGRGAAPRSRRAVYGPAWRRGIVRSGSGSGGRDLHFGHYPHRPGLSEHRG